MGDSNTEIELKLAAGGPAELDRLRAAPALRSAGEPGRGHLESVYYDTPDMRLWRRGAALRVRRVGNRFVQTIKTSGSGPGVQRRGEWETPVASLEPDPGAIPEGEARALLGRLAPGELKPLFATRIARETRLVDSGGVLDADRVVEVAFDEGVIAAADRHLPVSEVELELLRGTPASLYRLALELHEAAPLRIEPHSKAARGYALALDRPPEVRRSRRIALDADAPVDQAIGPVVRACLNHWTANQAAAADGRDPEGVHQLRVGLRRLRSAMSLWRGVVPDAQRQWIDAEAAQVLAALGPARDLDVFLAEVAGPVAAALPGRDGLAALIAAAEGARERAYQGVAEALAAPRYTSFVLRLGLWLEECAWREGGTPAQEDCRRRPLVALADAVLARRHKTALKRGKGFATLTAERRHRLRIAVKKLRYATEFFAGLYRGKRRKPYQQDLAAFQDRLGRLNDIAVAESLIDRLAREAGDADRGTALREGGAVVLGWHARGLVDHEPDLVKAWHDFTGRKPFWHKAGTA